MSVSWTFHGYFSHWGYGIYALGLLGGPICSIDFSQLFRGQKILVLNSHQFQSYNFNPQCIFKLMDKKCGRQSCRVNPHKPFQQTPCSRVQAPDFPVDINSYVYISGEASLFSCMKKEFVLSKLCQYDLKVNCSHL